MSFLAYLRFSALTKHHSIGAKLLTMALHDLSSRSSDYDSTSLRKRPGELTMKALTLSLTPGEPYTDRY